MKIPLCALSVLASSLFAGTGVSAQDGAQTPLGAGLSKNDSLTWVNRPNVYAGWRPRIPHSLLTGLLWSNVEDYREAQQNFRHTCEQHEGMAGYGWEEFDSRTGGRQVIHDAGNKIDLTIEYVKVPGGSHGGSWAARVKGTLRDDAPPNLVTTVIFYAGMEGLGELGFVNEPEEMGHKGDVTLHGSTFELGDFDIDVTKGPSSNILPYKIHDSWDDKPLDVTLAQSLTVPVEQLWRSKEIMMAAFKQNIDGIVKKFGQENLAPPWQAFTIMNDVRAGNYHMVQKVFVGAFEFDILFKSADGGAVSSETLTEAIKETSKEFKEKFEKTFKAVKGFTSKDYKACAQSMFSNLVGGIGYFYGDSLVDRSYAAEYDEEDEGFWEPAAEARARNQPTPDSPAELFTSVPSRPFFPRGFLWDEGFHLIPIVEWDVDLALQIVESWMRLMDEDGWIAREQILGPEARSKVPAEFQVQYPHYANPTTLFIVVQSLVDKIKAGKLPAAEKASLTARLEALYPLLQRHYSWYRKSQSGDLKSYDRTPASGTTIAAREAYRWRGRTPRHILPSGLDDYPRAQPPHPGELHLDLISWIGLAASSMQSLSTLLSESSDSKTYAGHLQSIQNNIDALHWSDAQHTYCDSTMDEYDESMLVCHKGYISLFPFMSGLLPSTHKYIPHILELISDPTHLWSPYGIRSLSTQDPHYNTDENYWRSPIWMNINYMIVKQLHTLATDPKSPSAVKKKAGKMFTDLRKNLVDNVVQQWKETGFAWEQYNPDTGAGQRTQHFTGWTSLVVVLMSMPDISGTGHGEL